MIFIIILGCTLLFYVIGVLAIWVFAEAWEAIERAAERWKQRRQRQKP